MKHEHNLYEPEPRHRADQHPGETEPDTTADAYIAEVVANAPTSQVGRIIAQTEPPWV